MLDYATGTRFSGAGVEATIAKAARTQSRRQEHYNAHLERSRDRQMFAGEDLEMGSLEMDETPWAEAPR